METTKTFRGFLSDNISGVDPDILQAIAAVNQDHSQGYGKDYWTENTKAMLQKRFGTAEIYFTFSGSAANAVALGGIILPQDGVMCSSLAHIYANEYESQMFINQPRYIIIPHVNGKITRELLEEYHAKETTPPKVVSITQPTEYGTIYTNEEVRDICDFAHANGMYVHMDGARLANAAVALSCELEACSSQLWVDVLFLGGIKNGCMFGETVLFFKKNPSVNLDETYERTLQNGSKSRFIAAQVYAYIDEWIWKRNATHANAMAAILASAIQDIPHVRITQDVQTNGVWISIPQKYVSPLQKAFPLYSYDETIGEVRCLCSFDTTQADIDAFTSFLQKLLA